MFKIVETFEKDDEYWAVVCRCENKFMTKKYIVKFSEILSKAGNLNTSNTGTVFKHEGRDDVEPKNAADKTVEANEGIQDSSLGLVSNPVHAFDKPPTRAAAIKARQRWNDPTSCRIIQEEVSSKTKFPTHGWSYETWLENIEDDQDYGQFLVGIHIYIYSNVCLNQCL